MLRLHLGLRLLVELPLLVWSNSSQPQSKPPQILLLILPGLAHLKQISSTLLWIKASGLELLLRWPGMHWQARLLDRLQPNSPVHLSAGLLLEPHL
jgi:hypothetical protein